MEAGEHPINSTEACEELRISSPTLDRWIKWGIVPYHVFSVGTKQFKRFYRSELAQVPTVCSKEAQKIVQKNRTWIAKNTRNGRIPATRAGKFWHYKIDDLHQIRKALIHGQF